MKRLLGAAVAVLGLSWGASANAATVITFEDLPFGYGYDGARIVDDGSGNHVLELTRQPGKIFIFVRAPGVQGIGNLPYFAHPVDEDLTDNLWPAVISFDIRLPDGGKYKWGGEPPTIIADPSAWYQDVRAYAFADRVYIDNITYSYESNHGLVPEPSTWAMLIAGFGLAGSALRHVRNRTARRHEAARR